MQINENNFLYSLSLIRKKAFAFLEKEMRGAGIEDIPPSYGDVLYTINQKGVVNLNDLCRLTNKDKSTVSIIVNALGKAGYVTKEKDKNDGRSVCIELSEKAAEHADRMMDISDRLREKLFSNMSEEEKEISFLLLNKISSNL